MKKLLAVLFAAALVFSFNVGSTDIKGDTSGGISPLGSPGGGGGIGGNERP